MDQIQAPERQGNMAIAEQFTGLPMEQLIGAPLRAAADASLQLAESTAEFIGKVGFDGKGKVRTAAFGYQRCSPNEDGTSSLEQMQVEIPLLAVVPVPNLQVDQVNLLFDIEVKQSERRESSMELSAGASGKLGALKVGITGSVSAHQTNTRSTDNSAKYHVDIRAANHGTPEGLARVLDMIAANMTPLLVNSALKDENGQPLSEQAQARAERLRELRSGISVAERQLRAAKEGLDLSLLRLRKLAAAQLNVYRETAGRLSEEMRELEDQEADVVDSQVRQQLSDYSGAMETVGRSWEAFGSRTGDFLRLLTDNRQAPEEVSGLFALKALDQWGSVVPYEDGEIYYGDIKEAQGIALKNQQCVDRLEEKLIGIRAEYNAALCGQE